MTAEEANESIERGTQRIVEFSGMAITDDEAEMIGDMVMAGGVMLGLMRVEDLFTLAAIIRAAYVNGNSGGLE